MSKRDELIRSGGANILASMGGGGGALPAGLDPATAVGRPAHLEGTAREKGALRIATGRIVPDPDQPRTEFDAEELGRLAESLRTRGQLQPIRVRWSVERGAYVLIMGERRWRAATMAGLPELSCIVHEGAPSADETLALQLVENALRADLTPIEQARAYRRLIDARRWSARQLAAELAVAPSTVTRALALLDLPAEVQGRVDRGELAAHLAYEVSRVEGAQAQAQVARAVAEQGLNREELARVVSAVRAKRPSPAPRPDPVTIELDGGCSVTIRWRKAGGPDAIQALRQATRRLQEGRKVGEGEAA